MPWNAKPVELEKGELPAVSLEKREPGRSFLFPGLKSWSLPRLCRRAAAEVEESLDQPARPDQVGGVGGGFVHFGILKCSSRCEDLVPHRLRKS